VLLVPPVVLGTGWFLALRPMGDISRFAPILVALVNALMALPFAMRVIAPAMEAHRIRTGRLSASLGLAGWSRIRHIDIPVLIRPTLMALSFAMALSLGDLGAVSLFGSSDFTTLPWLVYNRLASYRSNDADGLALILGIICLALTMIGTAGRERERPNA
jgi:thiamine transport system permease protein